MRIAHYENDYTYKTGQLLLLAKKIGRLARYCRRIKDESSLITIETIAQPTKKDRDSVKVMITLTLPEKTLRAESRKADALEAIDRCVEKLESQIEHYKDKRTSKGRARSSKSSL